MTSKALVFFLLIGGSFLAQGIENQGASSMEKKDPYQKTECGRAGSRAQRAADCLQKLGEEEAIQCHIQLRGRHVKVGCDQWEKWVSEDFTIAHTQIVSQDRYGSQMKETLNKSEASNPHPDEHMSGLSVWDMQSNYDRRTRGVTCGMSGVLSERISDCGLPLSEGGLGEDATRCILVDGGWIRKINCELSSFFKDNGFKVSVWKTVKQNGKSRIWYSENLRTAYRVMIGNSKSIFKAVDRCEDVEGLSFLSEAGSQSRVNFQVNICGAVKSMFSEGARFAFQKLDFMRGKYWCQTPNLMDLGSFHGESEKVQREGSPMWAGIENTMCTATFPRLPTP